MPDIKEKLVELLVDFSLEPNAHICDDCGLIPVSEACVEIADHLIANGVTIQRWISVEKRLPGGMENVLVCAFWHERWQTMIGWCRKSDEQWYVYTSHGERTVGNVTHWMPLPEPPKGE